MRRLIVALLLLAAACASGGGYVSGAVVYSEPPGAEYEGPVDRVVVVSREVLVARGYVVYRVQRDGPRRIVWARRGDGEVVRIFATPQGRRVAVRTVSEVREHDRRRVWARHEPPHEVVQDIDVRLRAR